MSIGLDAVVLHEAIRLGPHRHPVGQCHVQRASEGFRVGQCLQARGRIARIQGLSVETQMPLQTRKHVPQANSQVTAIRSRIAVDKRRISDTTKREPAIVGHE